MDHRSSKPQRLDLNLEHIIPFSMEKAHYIPCRDSSDPLTTIFNAIHQPRSSGKTANNLTANQTKASKNAGRRKLTRSVSQYHENPSKVHAMQVPSLPESRGEVSSDSTPLQRRSKVSQGRHGSMNSVLKKMITEMVFFLRLVFF